MQNGVSEQLLLILGGQPLSANPGIAAKSLFAAQPQVSHSTLANCPVVFLSYFLLWICYEKQADKQKDQNDFNKVYLFIAILFPGLKRQMCEVRPASTRLGAVIHSLLSEVA